MAREGTMWYTGRMKTTVDKKARGAAMAQVTTVEEAPILSDEERAEMIASLKAAEARIAAGEYVEHDPDTFVDRQVNVLRFWNASRAPASFEI